MPLEKSADKQIPYLASLYPSTPRGLNLEKALHRVVKYGQIEDFSVKGSTQPFLISINPDGICITPDDQPDFLNSLTTKKPIIVESKYELSLYHPDDRLDDWFFSLYTRHFDPKTQNLSPPHPDMNAKKFVDFALNVMQTIFDNRITTIFGKWYDESINWVDFRASLAKNPDIIQALSSTKCAQIYAKHGFTPVSFDQQNNIVRYERN